MFSIEHTLAQFTHALLHGKAIVADSKGHWAIEGAWRKSLRQIFGLEGRRLVDIAHSFAAILDSLETTPVLFPANSSPAPQMRDLKAYIRAAEAILSRLAVHQSPQAIAAHQTLKRKAVALRYRLEAVNDGLNPQAPRSDLQTALGAYAQAWKDSLEVSSESHLTDFQLAAIEEASRYPDYAELLLANEEFRLEFLNWSLRDKIPPSLLIQFPALCRKLILNGMCGRIGRMGGGTVLKLCKRSLSRTTLEKVVTLPIEGTDVSILDPSLTVTFRGAYTLSIEEIFEVFRDKYLRVGNLEFMQDGIINWNVQKWAWWNAGEQKYEAVDLTRAGWWKQFPFFETISVQQAKDRYGSEADGINWIAAATATRGRATLDVDLTHAYLEVAIPMDGSHYAIFDFGKQANEFPATYIDTLKMVCTTVHATIAHPDENVYYTHREHAQHALFLAPAEGLDLMESIKKDMISSRGLNFIYQIESENCAKWVHEKLEAALGSHAVPNMFVMSIFHAEPLGFLRALINFCKIFPEPWQIKALTFFHLPLGAAKGHWVLERGCLVWRALTHHSFWNTGTIYLPCFLHKQKELGHLDSHENILTNILDEADEWAPVPSMSPRDRVKDGPRQGPAEQSLEVVLSRWALTTYERLLSLVDLAPPPRELPVLLRKNFSPGMEFARL